MSRSFEPFTVRFATGTSQRLKARAAANRRSMNAEILVIVEEALRAATHAREAMKIEPATAAG